jgi:hypothetical protein
MSAGDGSLYHIGLMVLVTNDTLGHFPDFDGPDGSPMKPRAA